VRLRRVLGLWGPVALYLVFLTTLSGQSGLLDVEVNDKLLHVAGYTVLGLLTLRAFHGGFGPLIGWPTVGAVVFTVGYGVIDELHQSFVPGRNASISDVVADLAGAILAVAVIGVGTRFVDRGAGEVS
jgi:VanZ family protein